MRWGAGHLSWVFCAALLITAMSTVVWPNEAQAAALLTLDHVRVFVGLNNKPVRAISARVGDLNDRYQNLAAITGPTLAQAMASGIVIETPYQAANPSLERQRYRKYRGASTPSSRPRWGRCGGSPGG